MWCCRASFCRTRPIEPIEAAKPVEALGRGAAWAGGTARQSGLIFRLWGGSSAGRVLRSQCRGREFDPHPLHHLSKDRPFSVGLFPARSPSTGALPALALLSVAPRFWRHFPRISFSVLCLALKRSRARIGTSFRPVDCERKLVERRPKASSFGSVAVPGDIGIIGSWT